MPEIFCDKLKKQGAQLPNPPFPGQLGMQIYQRISAESWKMWLNHQTMLINEYRLSLIDPAARDFLRAEMEKYFFGEGSAKPSGFIPEDPKK